MSGKSECATFLQGAYLFFCQNFLNTCMEIESRSEPKHTLKNLFKPFNYSAVADEFMEQVTLIHAICLTIEKQRDSCEKFGFESTLDALIKAHALLGEYSLARVDIARTLADKSAGKPIRWGEYSGICQRSVRIRKELEDFLPLLNQSIEQCINMSLA